VPLRWRANKDGASKELTSLTGRKSNFNVPRNSLTVHIYIFFKGRLFWKVDQTSTCEVEYLEITYEHKGLCLSRGPDVMASWGAADIRFIIVCRSRDYRRHGARTKVKMYQNRAGAHMKDFPLEVSFSITSGPGKILRTPRTLVLASFVDKRRITAGTPVLKPYSEKDLSNFLNTQK
jgi:hypothetical protein